jgi:DNA-binding transcriptional ArsR family regulator
MLQNALLAGRPKILERLAQRSLEYYAAPQQTIPSLNGVNGSLRRQRSERREACLRVLGLLIAYTDLKTLRIGIPRPNGSLYGLSIDWIAERVELGQRRVERALSDLTKSGLVVSRQRSHRSSRGRYSGLTSIRLLSPHLFALLGLGKWLVHEQKRAIKRQYKLELKASARESALQLLALKAARVGASRSSPLIAAKYFELIRSSLAAQTHTALA